MAADVAALELRRLRGGLEAAASAVAALQRRKIELQGAVREQQRAMQACPSQPALACNERPLATAGCP